MMKLLSLKLKNFKGIRNLELATNGENTRIFGDNATGKTTIFDAFIWLLFDKDSQSKKDFDIKTLDKTGEAIHHLEHEVEGIFELKGHPFSLRKVYTEKWTRTRGKAIERFNGHESAYFLDGVPLKTKREYDTFIADIGDENIFKLLTNPIFFNENISWQDRRATILKVCGDISNGDVIAGHQNLKELAELLNNKNIDDLKTVISAKQTEINKELNIIPVRISELKNVLEGNSSPVVSQTQLEANVGNAQQLLANKDREILLAENGDTAIAIQLEIKEIDSQVQGLKNNLNKTVTEKIETLNKECYSLKDKKHDIEMELSSANHRKMQLESSNEECTKIREVLLKDYGNESRTEFECKTDNNNDCVCGFCGQTLPAEMLESNRLKVEKQREVFNTTRAAKLMAINDKGKQNNKIITKNNAEICVLTDDIAKYKAQIKQVDNFINDLTTQIVQLKNCTVETSPAIEALCRNRSELYAKTLEVSSAQSATINQLKEERVQLQISVENAEKQLAAFRQNQAMLKRIAELEERQVTLARSFEELGRRLYLTEEFTRTKTEMLTEKINSKFKMARFKMFDKNITNDGITECCATTLNGVPYKDLNNAAKINVGLDIIRTLSDYYNFKAPIFIDNAEAVTQLIDMDDTQIIQLVVSEHDKVLRVEGAVNELKEAI